MLLHSVACNINTKTQTDVIYTDIKKTCDSVNHRFLLHKLKLLSFSDNLLRWFQSYLIFRLQRVVINGVHSVWSNVLSGVHQGSILGPILHLIFINDLPSVLKYAKCLLYAKDAKFYKTVYGKHNRLKLQLNLNSIELWCQSWKLCLNISKWSNVLSGVHQGSILGPILLSIFINDLPSVLKYTKCLLYAEDAQFYKTDILHLK